MICVRKRGAEDPHAKLESFLRKEENDQNSENNGKRYQNGSIWEQQKCEKVWGLVSIVLIYGRWKFKNIRMTKWDGQRYTKDFFCQTRSPFKQEVASCLKPHVFTHLCVYSVRKTEVPPDKTTDLILIWASLARSKIRTSCGLFWQHSLQMCLIGPTVRTQWPERDHS